MTSRAKLLVLAGYATAVFWPTAVVLALYLSATSVGRALALFVVGIALTPLVEVIVLVGLVSVAYVCIARPHEQRLIKKSQSVLAAHPGTIVVIAGSYGKTTMKELLSAVLGNSLKVAATPGNGNTPIAHARFINGLEGDEQVLLFELGEGAPGDVRQFAETLHPDYAVVTGLAPNHLDRYKTVSALAEDVLSLRDFVPADRLYMAGDSEMLRSYHTADDVIYDISGGPDWRNGDPHITAQLTGFSVELGDKTVQVESSLIGRHQVAPLGLAAAIAVKMGVEVSGIEQAIRETKPYAHRMQPYQLGGATIIDDTYNGNLEGMLAGLQLLAELPAARRIYVTPGLVDQGEETEQVHQAIAAKIAEVHPDLLVLMENSATQIIRVELEHLKYDGEIRIEQAPLAFYQNLDQIVRAGDIVLMQNDWTDNYQ